MCMISPALEAFPESLSTLKFANRAKNIRNVATVNEDMDQRTLLKKYERELRRLRQELAQRSKVGKHHLVCLTCVPWDVAGIRKQVGVSHRASSCRTLLISAVFWSLKSRRNVQRLISWRQSQHSNSEAGSL